MERNMNLNEETDGRLYGLNDMAKVGCDDCQGCSACCHDMGSSIVLDPLDIYRLCTCLNTGFEGLLNGYVELNVAEYIILPNIKMNEKTNGCSFLNAEGRCSIHPSRPGICRIFPLGRLYEDDSFKYILQVNECPKPNKTKVKVGKWIDTPKLVTNQKFVNDWHYFLKNISAILHEKNDADYTKKVDMYILNTFFVTPYNVNGEEEFYAEFYKRFTVAKDMIC